MELSFTRTGNAIDQTIDELIGIVGGVHHPEHVREMIISALKAGQETDYLADLKMLNNTMKEMRYTNKIFGPYRHKKKVTIFGSARTEPHEPIYQKCVDFSRELVNRGFMTITGGGPGIMQAGNLGAGSEHSFAVNIRLPFEQAPNPVMYRNPRLITYKYFFNRKIAFVKEADAIAVFPGGFGTLDEAMEVFTLVQTGKTSPKPLVLIDDDSGYWDRFFDFIKDSMLGRGLISAEDFSIFSISRTINGAIDAIEGFYRNFHSIRFLGERLIIRLNKELTNDQIETLCCEFPELRLPGAFIERTTAFPEESDEPDLLDLPRISFTFDHQHYGLLIAFIGRINTF